MQDKSKLTNKICVKDIPVFVVHRGCQDYLKVCIEYASKHGHKIILIGDKSNKQYINGDNVWIDSENLSSEQFIEFEHTYKHMNANPYDYEKFCFERHFLIYKYIEKNKIDRFFVMDSDVLFGESEETENILSKELYNYDVGLCWQEDQGEMSWSVSPHFSYWTAGSLKSFIDYCLFTYESNIDLLKKKYDWHIQNNKLGGICDMTLLYLWSKSNQLNVINFTSVDNTGLGIDHQFINKNNKRYKTKNNIEILLFKEHKPYFISLIDGKQIQAFVIHAQGSAKRYMKMLSKCRFSWLGKNITDIKYYIQSKLKK